MVSMSVSFYAAVFVAFPILVYQLWMFVGVGLKPKERRLAFLFIPAGILFFYAGTVLGYFIGLPHYYAWMIKWTANDPTAKFSLVLRTYHQNFVLMTMIFGIIADIPWLIMVLVRVGFVTVEQLGRHRKIAILVNTIIAALIAPPDGLSMIIMMIPLMALFELGLVLSRLMMWHHNRMDAIEAKAAAAAAKATEEAERKARELAPKPEPTAVVPLDDAPVSRDQATSSEILDPHHDDASRLTEHYDQAERDTAQQQDLDADAHRDDSAYDHDHYDHDYHKTADVKEPPAPRGMDEAGMFTEESSDSANDTPAQHDSDGHRDHDTDSPREDDRRD
jgi:Tat protein translocase TatC